MNILRNLGKAMNILNNVKFLGKHQGSMRTLRVSLRLLDKWQKSLLGLGMSKKEKPREKARRRRRFNLLRNLLPRDRGLRKMIPQYIEKGH